MPHGLPPPSLSQGLPMAQPAASAPPSSLRLPSQAPGFSPPPTSAGLGASTYPPPAGISRPPTMQGSPLPGQAVTGILTSQPNHVTSPPSQPPMAGLPPGPPITSLQGPPPPTHPSQPGYQLQQNGTFSARESREQRAVEFD